jgi:WD40 repeat protein
MAILSSFDLTPHQVVRIWRTDTGECQQTLEGHSDSVNSIAFSHDSALLASASGDKTVRIWGTDTGECQQTLEGHSDWVRSVAFSHDSALLASASDDHTVRIWRTDTGECQQTVEIGVASRCLLFQAKDLELLTDAGVVAIRSINRTSSTKFPTAETPTYRSDYGISTDYSWITWHGDNILWLPKEFRPGCSAVSESTVVIGCPSGRLLFVSFSSDELPEALRHV